jgi:hypothetical protein
VDDSTFQPTNVSQIHGHFVLLFWLWRLIGAVETLETRGAADFWTTIHNGPPQSGQVGFGCMNSPSI